MAFGSVIDVYNGLKQWTLIQVNANIPENPKCYLESRSVLIFNVSCNLVK